MKAKIVKALIRRGVKYKKAAAKADKEVTEHAFKSAFQSVIPMKDVSKRTALQRTHGQGLTKMQKFQGRLVESEGRKAMEAQSRAMRFDVKAENIRKGILRRRNRK